MIHSYLGGSDIPSWFLSSEIFALAINLWFLLFTGSFPQTPPFLRDLHIPFPPPLLTSPFLGNPSRVSRHLRWCLGHDLVAHDARLRICEVGARATFRMPHDLLRIRRSLVVGERDLVPRWSLPKRRKGRRLEGWGSIDGNSGVFFVIWRIGAAVKTWYILLFGVDVCGPISATAFVKSENFAGTHQIHRDLPWCPIIMKVKMWILVDPGGYRDPELRNTPSNIQLVHGNRFFTDHLRLHSFPCHHDSSSPDPETSLRKCPNECGWSKRP